MILSITRWMSTRIGLAARGRAGKTVTVARDKAVQGRAQPTQGRQACNPAEPNQPGQNVQQGQPRFKSTQPLSFRSTHVHFLVEIGAREGRLCRYCGVVIIQESQPSTGIVWLDLRLRPPAERTGPVQKNVVLWCLRHRTARIHYDTVRRYREHIRAFRLSSTVNPHSRCYKNPP